MAGWRSWLGKTSDSRLKQLLEHYPPYRIPHRGSGQELTRAQADENLAYLLANRQQRLEIADGLLREFGLDLRAALVADNPNPFLDGLWRWTVAEWPSVYNPALTATSEVWLDSTRDGPEIVFSMLMDIAIALAEMVLVRRPDYDWTLDLDPANQADDMVSWQRPVLLRPAEGPVPAILFDFESAVRSYYVHCKSTPYRMLNRPGQIVLDAVSGAHEAFFRQQAGDGKA